MWIFLLSLLFNCGQCFFSFSRTSFCCQALSNTMSKALRPFPERTLSRLLSPPPPDIRIWSAISVSQRPLSVSRTQSKLSVLCKAVKRKKNSRILGSAEVKQMELQPTVTRVVDAQATGPSHSQGAHGSGSLNANTVQPASTTEIV